MKVLKVKYQTMELEDWNRFTSVMFSIFLNITSNIKPVTQDDVYKYLYIITDENNYANTYRYLNTLVGIPNYSYETIL